MAGYAGLGQVTDGAAKGCLKTLFDLTGQLTRQLAALQATALVQGSPYQAGGQRISDVGTPQARQDAVPLQYLRDYVAAQLALGAGGGTVAVDGAGALEETPLAVRVDGSSVIINGSNQLEAPGAAGGITQLTGDVLAGPGAGSEVATLAATGVGAGTYGSATQVAQVTVDAKGRVTAAGHVTISGGTSPWVQVSGSPWTYSSDVAAVDFTGLSGYSEILVQVVEVTLSVSGLRLVRVSSDNGATFLSTSGDYQSTVSAGTSSAATGIGVHETSATAARSGLARLWGFNVAVANRPFDRPTRTDVTTGYIPDATAFNAIRIVGSAGGNLTGGTIYVWGRA